MLGEAMTEARASHERLMTALDRLTDDQVADASLLPGWTRGHLLTHIARNADSHVRLLAAAVKGEKVEQYVGGAEGRAADIDAGATRSIIELVTDVDHSAKQLFETWERVPDSTWDKEIVAIHGSQPAWACVFSRWRETEIHHVDLDLDYGPDDWAPSFLQANLPHIAESLDRRLPTNTRVELFATDVDFTVEVGARESEPIRIEGGGGVLLAWLAGRPFDMERLTTKGGRLPEIGPWI
jgi:maleylpyruvate isomerase